MKEIDFFSGMSFTRFHQKFHLFPSLISSFTFAEISDEDSARGGEGDEEGDRKEPLRFESLEVTSLEQSVPDHLIKTYDEVNMKVPIVITQVQRKAK